MFQFITGAELQFSSGAELQFSSGAELQFSSGAVLQFITGTVLLQFSCEAQCFISVEQYMVFFASYNVTNTHKTPQNIHNT